MAVRTRDMNIQEFLYAVSSRDGDQVGSAPTTTGMPTTNPPSTGNSGGEGLHGSDPDGLPLTGANLRAEVKRHSDRTMTVVTLSGIETITRCGICPKEDTRPCRALRILAMPYAQHPAYRPEWSITGPDTAATTAQDAPRAVGESVVLPAQRAADLPPSAIARRRMLRQLGISFSQSDFTDEDLAQRGIEVETHAGPRANNP